MRYRDKFDRVIRVFDCNFQVYSYVILQICIVTDGPTGDTNNLGTGKNKNINMPLCIGPRMQRLFNTFHKKYFTTDWIKDIIKWFWFSVLWVSKLYYFGVFRNVIWKPFISKDAVLLVYNIQFVDDRGPYRRLRPEIGIYLWDPASYCNNIISTMGFPILQTEDVIFMWKLGPVALFTNIF